MFRVTLAFGANWGSMSRSVPTTRYSTPAPLLDGLVIPSDMRPGVKYRLLRQIGEGGMGQAYLAERESSSGSGPVVIKLVQPGFTSSDVVPELLVLKEAVALGRLNERVPATPFVVRLIDTGTTQLFTNQLTPWLAIEYVHGGIEGTTLEDRVTYSIQLTRYAFDSARAGHLVRCLASGLMAIHGVGVIHRDLTPGNILCCGFGESEIFKISDFGVARPQGLASTFGDVGIGTPGYAAPEQSFPGVEVGPFTDVFAFACVVFYALTSEHLFDADTAIAAYRMIQSESRRSLSDCAFLNPEIADRPEARQAIDQALARATSPKAAHRPQRASELSESLLPWLGNPSSAPRPSRRLVDSLSNLKAPADLDSWAWTIRSPPSERFVVQNGAWDTDARCFAVTSLGPLFWTGESWLPLPECSEVFADRVTFAHRYEAGGWLVGGEGGTLAVYSADGIREVVRAPDNRIQFLQANGRIDDLLAAISHRPGEIPVLWAMAARRWIKPLPLEGVRYVAGLLRLSDSEWLLCGRRVEGGGFAAIYSPLEWAVRFLPTPPTHAFVGGVSKADRKVALIVGRTGVAARIEGEQVTSSVAGGAPDLTAAAMDLLDREWIASQGTLWVRDREQDPIWQPVWSNAEWQAPFVSMMADAGRLIAMTVDGGILEGRAEAHPGGRV